MPAIDTLLNYYWCNFFFIVVYYAYRNKKIIYIAIKIYVAHAMIFFLLFNLLAKSHVANK